MLQKHTRFRFWNIIKAHPQDCQKQEPKIDPVVMQQAEVEMQAVKTAQSDEGKISPSDLGWGWIAVILLIIALFGGFGYFLYRKNRES